MNNPHLKNDSIFVQPYKDTVTRNWEEEYSGERQVGNLYFSVFCLYLRATFLFLPYTFGETWLRSGDRVYQEVLVLPSG